MICHDRECSSLWTRYSALRAHLIVLSPIVQYPNSLLVWKKNMRGAAVWAAFQNIGT